MSIKARLASQSTIIFGTRLMGAGTIVLAQAGIARIWGGEVLGEYLLIMAVINLVAMLMPLGFQSVGTYFAAEYRANGQGRLLWRFLLQSYAHVLVVGSSLGFISYVVLSQIGSGTNGVLLSGAMANVLGIFERYWMQGGILAFAIAIVFVNGAVLVGLKRPFAGFFADGIFRPLLVVLSFALAALLTSHDQKLDLMLWGFALGYCVVALVHFGIVVRSVREISSDESGGRRQSSRWWRFALPWVLIDLATLFFFDIDLILLSGLMDREMLAIFGVCTRMFALMAFGITAVYAVSLPDMFEAAANSERSEFFRKLGDANFVAVGLSVVLFVAVLVGGPFVLLIFGTAFMSGSIPLAILSLALVVRSAFGPAALVLSIHDHPWASLPSIGVGMLVLVIGNYLLVPMFGLTGAALAALAAFSIWSALMWWTALAVTGLDVSVLPRLRMWVRSRARSTPAE
ncbi:MAG: polysaccharide biosynthesis C-terminal domain-containing protein [Devosiaceae bacterium]|nr:polysaccharide biosynthesis C-terminal domain-containing protein [Devosiaceae bacterium]